MDHDAAMRAAEQLSATSLDLAKEVASQGGSPERQARADQLAAAIDDLRADAGSPDLETVLTDAVLDVDWIRSGCKLPTSTRLHHILEDEGWTGPPADR